MSGSGSRSGCVQGAGSTFVECPPTTLIAKESSEKLDKTKKGCILGRVSRNKITRYTRFYRKEVPEDLLKFISMKDVSRAYPAWKHSLGDSNGIFEYIQKEG